MRLAKFIISSMEPILAEWEAFARTLMPEARRMSSLTLRDHAKPILTAIANDIDRSQAASQQRHEGLPVKGSTDYETPAAAHGALRRTSGFDMQQLAAEYRSMRSSVIKLWMAQLSDDDNWSLDEVLHFNEAVDLAMEQSIISYGEEVSRSRNTFLAILGHDLRSPLSAITMAGSYLHVATTLPDGKQAQIATTISRSAATMARMIKDLLDYSSTRLGKSLPLNPVRGNLATLCQLSIDEISSAHPEKQLMLSTSGDLEGVFDPDRVQQVLSNLLNNAVQHGAIDSPIRVSLKGGPESIILQVQNFGPPIAKEDIPSVFDPLVRIPTDEVSQDNWQDTSLGLGLYIARQVMIGHGGTINVESDEASGTVFTCVFPRQ
ncbi:sensor histidine kinase [Undibacterium terreum]|uniref:histidine kinase n=1 Tax=Undibacterium terreum TaxID=1224302 RepID=A0A916UC30_9BURK|nr:HAMP domain-containing sensor histidine kinase [Undibacterium terreum]GGC67985.1 two-component sensor histidine kinase [Undibacterium terreum]